MDVTCFVCAWKYLMKEFVFRSRNLRALFDTASELAGIVEAMTHEVGTDCVAARRVKMAFEQPYFFEYVVL